jgi:hypothetical protein
VLALSSFPWQGGQSMKTGAMTFRNNYAINDAVEQMPTRDVTVEFWARTPAMREGQAPPADYAEFFSYATHLQGHGVGDATAATMFADDAILIEKVGADHEDSGSKECLFAVWTACSVGEHTSLRTQELVSLREGWGMACKLVWLPNKEQVFLFCMPSETH